MNYRQQMMMAGGALSTLFTLQLFVKSAVYKVETGQKAFKFNKYSGVQMETYKEGWHLKIPYFEYPVIYNVKS